MTTQQQEDTVTKTTWHRVSAEPITTQSRTAVEDDQGRVGWVGIRWANNRPSLYGHVYAEDGAVLDATPTFD